MLYSKSLLLIYCMYSSLYLLILNYWFILPLSIPFRNCIFVFYVYESVFLWYIKKQYSYLFLYLHYFLDSTYKWYQRMFVFLWIISLSIIFSMLLQMKLFHSFYGWVIFHSIYEPHLLIHLSVDGHGLLLYVSYCKAAMNIRVCVSFQIFWINTQKWDSLTIW